MPDRSIYNMSTKLSKDDTKRSEPVKSNDVVSQHKPTQLRPSQI